MPSSTVDAMTADSLEIRFPVKVSLIVAVVTAALSGLFFLYSGSNTEALIFFVATTAAAGAVLAAIYTARTLNLQLATAQSALLETVERKRTDAKKYAITLASRWNDPAMLETRSICRRAINLQDKSLLELRPIIESDETLDRVIHLLNFLEEVAISADEDVADDRLLDEFFAEIFFQVWTSLEVWIIHYRKLRNAKNMWGAFEKRTAKWKQA